jgi:hypothetical protein
MHLGSRGELPFPLAGHRPLPRTLPLGTTLIHSHLWSVLEPDLQQPFLGLGTFSLHSSRHLWLWTPNPCTLHHTDTSNGINLPEVSTLILTPNCGVVALGTPHHTCLSPTCIASDINLLLTRDLLPFLGQGVKCICMCGNAEGAILGIAQPLSHYSFRFCYFPCETLALLRLFLFALLAEVDVALLPGSQGLLLVRCLFRCRR